MANHVSNYCLQFIMVFLVVAGGSIVPVASEVCTDPLGGCGPIGECDQRCKAKHPGGDGSCDLGLCTCGYTCPPPPSPPQVKFCNGGLGLCSTDCNDDCCDAKCAIKYNKGIGYCDSLGNTRLCTCQYVCSS